MISLPIKPFRRRNFRYMQGMDKIFNKTESIRKYPLLSILGEKD